MSPKGDGERGGSNLIAELLAVGTELLLGDIANTNAQFLSKELARYGITVYFHTVVGDNPARIQSALDIAFGRADLVITTGGLGPTMDDITKEMFAEYFDLPLIQHAETQAKIDAFFESRGRKPTSNNNKQALIIEGSTVLPNEKGTAPGILLEHGGKACLMFPGPPFELRAVFEHARPFLRAHSDSMFISNTLHLSGIGESEAEHRVRDLIEKQTNPTIAPYAKASGVDFRITARAKDEREAADLIAPVKAEILSRIGEFLITEDDEKPEARIVREFAEKGIKLAIAESCTGGLIASRITDVAGASAVLVEGLVTYSNEAKIRRLGVKPETLEQYGAVSQECAQEMATGLLIQSGSDIAISVTGIAGPDGGTPEKPVGLVYIALADKNGVTAYKQHFNGDRERVRLRAAAFVFEKLLRWSQQS